jgi:hypothetical protein
METTLVITVVAVAVLWFGHMLYRSTTMPEPGCNGKCDECIGIHSSINQVEGKPIKTNNPTVETRES